MRESTLGLTAGPSLTEVLVTVIEPALNGVVTVVNVIFVWYLWYTYNKKKFIFKK